jgi:hypothetical protein
MRVDFGQPFHYPAPRVINRANMPCMDLSEKRVSRFKECAPTIGQKANDRDDGNMHSHRAE